MHQLVTLQVEEVRDACQAFLSEAMLSPGQLLQLTAVYDSLDEYSLAAASWHKLFSLPWVPSVAVAVTAGCAHLLRMQQGGLGLLEELLHSADCGALCEMQVTRLTTACLSHGVQSCSMLTAVG